MLHCCCQHGHFTCAPSQMERVALLLPTWTLYMCSISNGKSCTVVANMDTLHVLHLIWQEMHCCCQHGHFTCAPSQMERVLLRSVTLAVSVCGSVATREPCQWLVSGQVCLPSCLHFQRLSPVMKSQHVAVRDKNICTCKKTCLQQSNCAEVMYFCMFTTVMFDIQCTLL